MWLYDEAFEAIAGRADLSAVKWRSASTGYTYRSVKVWRFVFLYRIDESREVMIVDAIHHEASDFQGLV